MRRQLLALAALGTLIGPSGSLPAQETRPIAITNARIITIDAEIIPNGTILIRSGKIAEVGAKVTVPPGSRIIDAQGGSVMPGLVSAWSRAGLTRAATPAPPRRNRSRGRRGGRRQPSGNSSKAKNQAADKIADGIYARQDVFGELLHTGVTTLAVHPEGSGLPGQAALLNLAAKDGAELTIDDQCYLTVFPEMSSDGKKLLREALDAGSKILEERNKPEQEPAEPKADDQPDSKPEEKPAEKPSPKPEATKDAKAPTSKPATKPKQKPKAKKADPHALALADLLDGKQVAFVKVASANEFSHYLDSLGEHSFTTTIVAASQAAAGFAGFRRRGGGNTGGSLTLMLDELKKLKARVLMRPALGTKAGTDILINEAAMLDAAGIEVGFLLGDRKADIRNLFFQLIDLVRHGLSAQTALRAVTLTPAECLKVDADVGSISVGKQANLLLFSGDPLDPSAKMVSVFYRGKEMINK